MMGHTGGAKGESATNNGRQPLLVGRSLRKVFAHALEKVVALDGVDLDLHAGELLAVTGSSGSGKTTLLAVLAGLVAPTAGEVRYAGESDRRSPALGAAWRLREIGLVFQRPALIAALTARDNVRVPLQLAGRLRGSRERATELLERLGLGDRAGHVPRELSRGELQRVALARAAALEPSVILADEPTAHLDRAARDTVLEFLREHARGDTAVLLATHNAELAAAADRRIELSFGRVVAGDRGPEVTRSDPPARGKP